MGDQRSGCSRTEGVWFMQRGTRIVGGGHISTVGRGQGVGVLGRSSDFMLSVIGK